MSRWVQERGLQTAPEMVKAVWRVLVPAFASVWQPAQEKVAPAQMEPVLESPRLPVPAWVKDRMRFAPDWVVLRV
jgi:hypothetical protein